MCIIDFLANRDLLRWLKKVTLIEPSEAALLRAEQNVLCLTQNSVETYSINKYLPSNIDIDNILDDISYRCSYVIHCFSNILDVCEIDLCKLARLVASSRGTHIILCMGPLNSQAYRINHFCSIFGNQDFFCNVDSALFARTSTGHPFTCVARGFVYNGAQLDFNAMESIHPNNEPVYSDYDLHLQVQNKILNRTKGNIAYRLNNILLKDDIIYYNVQINEAAIDFLIIRPHVGIILINVFEEDIKLYENENIDDQDNRDYALQQCIIEGSDVIDILERQSPIAQINSCQISIKDSIEELLVSTIEETKNLGLIKKVIIFTENTNAEIENFFSSCNFQYVTLYGKEFIDKSYYSKELYTKLNFNTKSPVFTDVVLHKLTQKLSPQWHSYRQGGANINLTAEQRKLAISQVSEQKISGVAGSGKTQVLVTRAINAQKRTGGDILLLTFNITLANYLTYRLNDLREDFSWNKIHIDFYHHFFRLMSSKFLLHVEKKSYENENFFERVCKETPRYKAIFVDEAQDYNTIWLKILHKYFLEKNGEFVVFGDPKQNIYNREVDENGDIRLGIIKGQWNKSLKQGKRFTNPLLAQLAMSFQSIFMDNRSSDLIETDNVKNDHLNFNILAYRDMRLNSTIHNVVKQCINYIKYSGLKAKDFVILSSSTEILRHIDSTYKELTNENTKISFLTEDEINHLKLIHEIKNETKKVNWKYRRDFDAWDRSRKTKFTTDCDCLKLSTIHSFKGWESPGVILLLDQETAVTFNNFTPCTPQVIYTGITRAREMLYIINIDNSFYHDFFNSL